MIEISAIGGYDEVGKNMTAVRIGDSVIILDIGLNMSNFIELQGKEDVYKVSAKHLIDNDCIPNDRFIEDWWGRVKLIIPSHAHLDHVGAVPFLSNKFKVPIMGTPFTLEVLKAQLRDNSVKLANELKVLNSNSTFTLDKDVKIEFIHVTHSTPQTVMVAIHTKKGVVLYSLDHRFDNYPVLGEKPNYKRLRALGRSGKVLALIADSTRADVPQKTPSEAVATAMLRDVFFGTESEGNLIVATTFSSHLARLKTLVSLGQKKGREVILIGRSLDKYISAGRAAGITNFAEDVRILKYRKQIDRFFRDMNRGKSRGKYLLIVTGHQGEPNATLSRMADGEFDDFSFHKGDLVIFSCRVIPDNVNQQNRDVLERKLKKRKVRLFTDLHVSGHAAREDLRDLITMTKPTYIIPAHGHLGLRKNVASLAREMNYDRKKIIMLQNGERFKLL